MVVFPQIWGFPLRERVWYLVVLYLCNHFLSLQIDLQKSSLCQLVSIWVSPGFPYTHEETCLAAKLLKYHLFNTVSLSIFRCLKWRCILPCSECRTPGQRLFYLTFDWALLGESWGFSGISILQSGKTLLGDNYFINLDKGKPILVLTETFQ